MNHDIVKEILHRYENYFNYNEDYKNKLVKTRIQNIDFELKKLDSENYVTKVLVVDKTKSEEYILYGLWGKDYLHTREFHRENNIRYRSVDHPCLSSIKLMYHVNNPYLLTTEKRGTNLGKLQEATSFKDISLDNKLFIVSQTIEALDAINKAKVQEYKIYLESINLVEDKKIFIRYSPYIYFVNTTRAARAFPFDGKPEWETDIMSAFPKERESNQIARYIYIAGVIMYKLLACKDNKYHMPFCKDEEYLKRKELADEIRYSIKKENPKYHHLLTNMCLKALYSHPKEEEYSSLKKFMKDVNYANERSKTFLGRFF